MLSSVILPLQLYIFFSLNLTFELYTRLWLGGPLLCPFFLVPSFVHLSWNHQQVLICNRATVFSDHQQSLIPGSIRRKWILPRLGQIPQSCKTLQAINGLELEILLCVCLYAGERVKEIPHA